MVIKPGIEDYRISVEHDTARDVATATLVIKHLNRSDDGLYTCIATNKVWREGIAESRVRPRPGHTISYY